MIYCDYDFYKNEYLGVVISESDFPRLAKRASDKIDFFTFNHLHVNDGVIKYTWEDCREFHVEDLPERIQTKVKECCCALAEKLADLEVANETIRSAGGAGISSVSSGSESISFSANAISESEMNKACDVIVREYLTGTNLLYAGF